MANELKKTIKQGRYLVKEAKRIVRKYRGRLSAEKLKPLSDNIAGFETAVKTGDANETRRSLRNLETLLDGEFAVVRKSAVRDWIESLLIALLIALFLRSFVVEAFKIPSGSMIPTLMVGDHIFVNKFIYGIRIPIIGKRIVDFGLPERGDVIVFVYPNDPDKDYIKRVIGLPGDVVRVEGVNIYVNGEKVKQKEVAPFSYLDENSGLKRHCMQFEAEFDEDSFHVIYEPGRRHPITQYKVEPGHLFVMGDNRDNSADSRVWGQVPINNIKGKALLVWWSSSSKSGFNLGRIGTIIE